MKPPVLLAQPTRAVVIAALRDISFVYCAVESTAEVLRELQRLFYMKGDDWVKRGGVPKCEAEVCQKLGIEIQYVDTVRNSSTKLVRRLQSE